MGSLEKGYCLDFHRTLTRLFEEGISPHTVFTFPQDTSTYPVILLASAARMTDAEIASMKAYLAAGGKVIATGPCAVPGCEHNWQLPNRLGEEHELFSHVPDGVHLKHPKWNGSMELPPCTDPDEWQEPMPGLFYHPHRISSGVNIETVLELCRKHMKPMPIRVKGARGYLSTIFDAGDQYIVHFLAADYDVQINEELDKIRYHRSRVNLITHAEPIGIDCVVQLEAASAPVVYTPFCDEGSTVTLEDGLCTVHLPDKCSYAILQFDK